MSANKLRKSWTTQDNILLAETIVKVVNSGKTFSDAYREAGKLLGRSPFACEKQWRDKLKSKYISQIKKSTAATKKLKTNPKSNSNTNPIPKPINMNETLTVNEVLQSIFSQNLTSNELVEKIVNLSQKNKDFQRLTKPLVSTTENEQKDLYDSRKKVSPVNGATKLAMLCKSLETFKSENFKILKSGKDGYEYIVINNEEDYGYLVKVDGDKVVGCNCPHHYYRGAICKHMLKVAFDKNLEVF